MSKEMPQIGEKLPAPVAGQVEKQLGGAIEKAKAARITQQQAEDARRRLEETSDPAERQKLEEEAKKFEKLARSQAKMARRLESGAWQGAGAGMGIGAASGMGVGTVVGLILGAVTAVPTTLVGGIVGVGTGAIHGPWVKLGAEEGLAEGKKQLDDLQAKAVAEQPDMEQKIQDKAHEADQYLGEDLQAQIAEAQTHGTNLQARFTKGKEQTSNSQEGVAEDVSDDDDLGSEDDETDQQLSNDPLGSLDTAAKSYSSFPNVASQPEATNETVKDDSQQYKQFAMQGLGMMGKAFKRSPEDNNKENSSDKHSSEHSEISNDEAPVRVRKKPPKLSRQKDKTLPNTQPAQRSRAQK